MPKDGSELYGIRDLDLLTIGMVNEMFIENQNDDVADKVYKVKASQHDLSEFVKQISSAGFQVVHSRIDDGLVLL